MNSPAASSDLSGRQATWLGGAIGLLLAIPWSMLGYLGGQAGGLPIVPFGLFEAFTRLLPGAIVTFLLDLMVSTLQQLKVASTANAGKLVETLMAYGLGLALLALIGAAYASYTYESGLRVRSAWGLCGLVSFISLVIGWIQGWGTAGPWATAIWLILLALGWGWAAHLSLVRSERTVSAAAAPGRRGFLVALGTGSVLVGGLAFGLARLTQSSAAPPQQTLLPTGEPLGPTPTPLPSDSQFAPVPGTRREITPIDQFYRVDINIVPPDPAAVSEAAKQQAQSLNGQSGIATPSEPYFLLISGLVQSPMVVGLDQVRAMPTHNEWATLECISNSVGGDLISTTLFTGARLADLLGHAGVKPEAVDIRFTCADGYTESLPLDSALDERTLVCYAMGGELLQPQHGFPFRLYTPDRFGMKNPKWLVLIEAINHNYGGYWEDRGWNEQAIVETTSVIDSVQQTGPGQAVAGGIAYAGARGIRQVETSLDGGPWQPAQLNRALSDLTWVLWRANLSAGAGSHALRVRATDGNGVVQSGQPLDTFPKGATGYDMSSFDLTA